MTQRRWEGREEALGLFLVCDRECWNRVAFGTTVLKRMESEIVRDRLIIVLMEMQRQRWSREEISKKRQGESFLGDSWILDLIFFLKFNLVHFFVREKKRLSVRVCRASAPPHPPFPDTFSWKFSHTLHLSCSGLWMQSLSHAHCLYSSFATYPRNC